jgi:hypothetical protein
MHDEMVKLVLQETSTMEQQPSFDKCIELEAHRKIGNAHWTRLSQMVYGNKVPDSELKSLIRMNKTINKVMVRLMSKYADEIPSSQMP